MEYIINLNWDSKSSVWIASSPEIRGLVLEAESLDILKKKIEIAVPELLLLNQDLCQQTTSFRFVYSDICKIY